MALVDLPRMRELVADSEGVAEVYLGFKLDESGRRIISGRVSASVKLACQRCLEPVDVFLKDELNLEVVTSEGSSRPHHDQAETLLCPDMLLDVLDLVDEQLVLCLPIVALHEQKTCAGVTGDDNKTPVAVPVSGVDKVVHHGAFALLEQLKRK